MKKTNICQQVSKGWFLKVNIILALTLYLTEKQKNLNFKYQKQATEVFYKDNIDLESDYWK